LNQRNIPFDSIVAQIGAMGLVAKPGAELHYGGLSMQIAGRAAEKAAGMAWEEIFQKNIAQPLGMTSTTFGKTRIGRNPRIAGGAVSTANDFVKFLQMLLDNGRYNGKQVLSEKAVALMMANQTGQAKIVESPFTKFIPLLQDKTEVRYGIGVWREVVHPVSGKIIEAVSPGAFGFTPWIDFENKLVGVISIRSAFPKVMPVYLEVKKLIKAELASKG
ncbi:MAG: serine hydrolase domain-containing protein, partial [Rufibacter sp.]